VFKRLLLHWLEAPQYKHGSVLHSSDLLVIKDHLREVIKRNKYCPEFSRKPRWLKDTKRFKATEFRQMLLYTGVVIFLNRLPEIHFKIFLLFVVSMRYLTNLDSYSEEARKRILEYVKSLLRLFVVRCEAVYGSDFITYNSHILIHLTSDCAHFGELTNFDCFAFDQN